MEWYIPITILPGVGFLILSTSNFLIALNEEIKELELEKDIYKTIIFQKLQQLKTLSHSLIGQFLASFLLVVGGVLGELFTSEKLINSVVLTGVFFLAISIGMLIVFSVKSLKIRQNHLKL